MDHVIGRRSFLAGGGVAALAATGALVPGRGSAQQSGAVPNSAGAEAPKLKAPALACDCHHHIYDARWPYAKTAVLKPPPATTADYHKYQVKLGTSRSIAVTPSTYAFNNDPIADFLAARLR